MSDTSAAATDSPTAKPSRLRKWSVRFLKTLGVLAALFALVHAVEYWRGNRSYDRALADWKAAGLPTAEEFFKDDPVVQPEKNLLDAPFFSEWKQPSSLGSIMKPDPRLEKWSHIGMTLPSTAPNSFETNWRTLFTSSDKRFPGLKSVTGKSDAQVLIDSVETDYPELKTFGDAETTRTEVSFGYKCPPLNKLFSGDQPSFKKIRDSSYALLFHAAAKLDNGDGAPALRATRASLRIEKALGEGNQLSLVSTMIACVHAKQVPIRLIFEATRLGAWSDAELKSIEAPLESFKPLVALHTSMMAEALAMASFVKTRTTSEIATLISAAFDGDYPNIGALAGFATPRGWLKTNAAAHLDITRENLAIDGAKEGRAFLTAQSAKAAIAQESTMNPDYFIQKLSQPAFKKVRANASLVQSKINCARLGIALERHRLKTGAFPDLLDALAPGLMEKIPVGPVTGLAPVYSKNTDGGYTLTYKSEDFYSDYTDTPNSIGKDIVWTMPAPKAR